jgi:hypothetical protein
MAGPFAPVAGWVLLTVVVGVLLAVVTGYLTGYLTTVEG